MRTKPLNPNSMAMIMENFRRYTDDVENEKDIDRMYLLREGAPPQETTLSELLEKQGRGEINFVELVELMEHSTNYEYEQLIKTETEGLTENEIHELFGQKRQDKWAKIAAGEEEGAEEGAKKSDPTLKFRIREKLLTFAYGRVSAALKASYGQEKQALGPLENNLKQAQAAIQKGNTKAALKLLGAGALKASLKGVKMFFKGLLGIVKLIAGVVGKIGKLMRHPIVRVLLLGSAIIALLQVTTISAGVYASYKVANKVTALATGKSLTGHIVGAAGKAAVQGAASAIGLEETEQVNEDIEGMMSFAEVMDEMGTTEVAAAIISLGEKLENQEVMRYAEDAIYEMEDAEGNIISYDEDYFQYSNEALASEMHAFGILKTVLSKMQAGEELTENAGIPPEIGEAMVKALEAGKAACLTDEAHCTGVEELSKTWELVWDGHISGEITDYIHDGADGVAEWTTNMGSSIGTQSIQNVAGGVSPTSWQR